MIRDVNNDSSLKAKARPRIGMTLSSYFMPNSVFVPAVLDTEGSTFKDNCIKSNKHKPILSAAKI